MNELTHEPNLAPTIRHDGWTGEAMAKFLETLAETGIVLEACAAACKSSPAAYSLRQRNPLFAEGWEVALGIARERLADTLLARSLEGNVEQIVKDGEIVAEKHFLDNRLGLAVLKRLDQRVDGPKAPARQLSPSRTAREPDWDLALTALRTGEADDIAAALAMLKGDEVSEVSDPPFPDGPCKLCAPIAEEKEKLYDPGYTYWDEDDGWWTDFPPPETFDGHEQGTWGCSGYKRECTGEEAALLEADRKLCESESLAEAAAERDRWMAELRAELKELGAFEFVNGTSALPPYVD